MAPLRACRPASPCDVGRSGISTVDLNERLTALENRIERYEDEIDRALTDDQVAEAREKLWRIRADGAQELTREREGRTHVLDETADCARSCSTFGRRLAPPVDLGFPLSATDAFDTRSIRPRWGQLSGGA